MKMCIACLLWMVLCDEAIKHPLDGRRWTRDCLFDCVGFSNLWESSTKMEILRFYCNFFFLVPKVVLSFFFGGANLVTVSLVPADSARLCPGSTLDLPSPPHSQPKGLFVHCRTSPSLSPQSPVPTPKTPVPPSSQSKGLLFVHCRTSPSLSPLSPVPTPKTPVPPSSQPKGLFVLCRTSPSLSPLSPGPPLKPQSPPVPNLKGCLFIVEHLHV